MGNQPNQKNVRIFSGTVQAEKSSGWKQAKAIPEGMMEIRRKSAVPFYFVAVIWIIAAFCAPLYRWYHFLIWALISVMCYWLSSKIFKGKKELVPVPKPEPEPAKPLTEEEALVAEGRKAMRELRLLNDLIEDTELSVQMDRLEQVGEAIFRHIEEHPEKAPRIRKFMNYYLPTTLKLLESYYRMSKQGVAGVNIQGTMDSVRYIMGTIVAAFEKQLDNLFGDVALDISTDVTVLENMLKQEGLTDDFKPRDTVK